jgi:hypothetical protein
VGRNELGAPNQHRELTPAGSAAASPAGARRQVRHHLDDTPEKPITF